MKFKIAAIILSVVALSGCGRKPDAPGVSTACLGGEQVRTITVDGVEYVEKK